MVAASSGNSGIENAASFQKIYVAVQKNHRNWAV